MKLLSSTLRKQILQLKDPRLKTQRLHVLPFIVRMSCKELKKKKKKQTETTAIVNNSYCKQSDLKWQSFRKWEGYDCYFSRDQIRISFLLLYLFGAFRQCSFTLWGGKKWLQIWTQMMLKIYSCINQSDIKVWHCKSTEAQALLAPLRKVLMRVTAKTGWCTLVHQSIWVQTPSRGNNHAKTVNKLVVKSYEYFKILQSI